MAKKADKKNQAPEEKKSTGRPCSHTPEIAAEICERIAQGESLRGICKDEHMPDVVTVVRWLGRDDMDIFRQQYARARDLQAHLIEDEILEIADDGLNDKSTTDEGLEVVHHDVIQRSKLRVETRKWLLGKLMPKKYGDKLDLNIKDGNTRVITPE